MPISTQLQAQIDAIQTRIDTLAPSATPEDIVMLAKAVEAVGGQATVFDVIETGQLQKAELISTAATMPVLPVESDSILLPIRAAESPARPCCMRAFNFSLILMPCSTLLKDASWARL